MKTPKQLLTIAIVIYIGLAVCGCVVKENEDGTTTTYVDPNKAKQVEGAATAAITITGALSVLWPPLGALSVAGAGLLAAWRQQKNKVIVEQSKTKMYHSATEALVGAIEQFKTDDPKSWESLEVRLKKTIGPKAENVIRALRKLSPIE